MSMDEKRLAEIEGRVAKASPGPWTEGGAHGGRFRDELVDGPNSRGDPEFPVWPIIRSCSSQDAWERWDAGNRAFVAHARQDVPDLVAEVRRLIEVNAAYVRLLKDHGVIG